MRVAVIVLSMLLAATSSQASDSCMSKAEARQHFGSAHIYWHGPDHCWGVAPTRHGQARRTQQKTDRQVQRKTNQPTWREAMSEILPDAESVQTQGARDDGSGAAAVAANWLSRWVDIVEIAPPPTAEPKSELMVASPVLAQESDRRGVVVLVLFFLLTVVAIIEVLLRKARQR
jgi:hypothetical protein